MKLSYLEREYLDLQEPGQYTFKKQKELYMCIIVKANELYFKIKRIPCTIARKINATPKDVRLSEKLQLTEALCNEIGSFLKSTSHLILMKI